MRWLRKSKTTCFPAFPPRRLDFDDLLVEAYLLLRDDAKAQKLYQSQWDYLLVDETQDTSQIQWDFAVLLAKQHGNLFLVGGCRAECLWVPGM